MPEQGRPEAVLAGELLEAFSRFDRAMHVNGRRAMAQHTKPGQVFVLFNLKKKGPQDGSGLRVSEIAGCLGVTPSSITQIVTDLEARGLVIRNMDKADRRAVRVSLTEEGERLIEGFHRPYLPVMDSLAQSLGSEKCRTLIDLLAEVDDFFLKDGRPAGGSATDKENQDR